MNSPAQNAVGSSLLYLAIDLGPRPTMLSFGQEVDAINVLWSHCVRLALFRSLSGGFHDQAGPGTPSGAADNPEQFSLVLRRTRMESPWVSVLTTLAERSAPAGYGLGALWGLQRLLHMVMEWQRHRLDLELGRRQLEALPTAEDLVRRHAVVELDPVSGRLPPGTPSTGGVSVPETVERLRPVLDARMVDEGDDVP
jgi:hypothetical protein